jgi:hypothetical protein
MIEQKLIRRELETNRYPEPSRSDVALKVEAFRRANYKDDAEYRQALAGYEISEQDLEDQILWQNTLLLFIEVRFRPGVQVSDEEIRDYFEKTVKAAADAAHPGEPVSLEDYRDKIEQTIAEPRLLREVDRWLAEMRRRTEIIYHDETLL